MNEITLKFTPEEIKMLIEIINAVSFNGTAVEALFSLKTKIKQSLEMEKEIII